MSAVMPKMQAVVAQMEPLVRELVHSAEPCPSDKTIALLSIAVSLKRIADALDHICNYGIITGSE